MSGDYAPRVCIPFASGTLVEHPPEMPELVHMDDPATYVMTDFFRNRPMTISPDVAIDSAMNKLKIAGSHLLLVTDDDDTVVGQITSCDIMGDAPVRLATDSGMKHSEITVKMIMTPLEDLQVIEWSHIKSAKVGHILATMHQLEVCFLPVVQDGRVRGLFAASEISMHLGHDVTETILCAHTLAEIVHTLG